MWHTPLPMPLGRLAPRCAERCSAMVCSIPIRSPVTSRICRGHRVENGPSSPHPCRTYGVARPAERLDSTALGYRSLIRMRSEVQVLPGPPPAEMQYGSYVGSGSVTVYRMTPHNCITC